MRHFYIAKGSGAELLTQAIIASEINYLSIEEFNHIETESILISKMLYKLIEARYSKLEEPFLPYPEP
ncbi:MAG TPA: hypothetical protein DC042_18895 [Bacteroidales bacterium]|nr:hypothetical protein [Bacteroidales bacterium]